MATGALGCVLASDLEVAGAQGSMRATGGRGGAGDVGVDLVLPIPSRVEGVFLGSTEGSTARMGAARVTCEVSLECARVTETFLLRPYVGLS